MRHGVRYGEGMIDTSPVGSPDASRALHDALRLLDAASQAASVDGRVRVTVTTIDSPVGPLLLGASADHLLLLEFTEPDRLTRQLTRLGATLGATFEAGDAPLLAETARQLCDYFARRRTTFDLPLGLRGTPFQVAVWRALLAIPAGETRSYSDVARAVERPDAVRAVARANGDNRLAIVVPCHRVIGADGSLTGYGGGLWRKQRLLDLERGVRSLLDA